MGFETERFENSENSALKELICSICLGVFESPLEIITCQHIFCSICIFRLMQSGNNHCPIDKQLFTELHLREPRKIKRIIENLKIKCDFASTGCKAIFELENLSKHLNDCDFNPNNKIQCQCEIIFKKNELLNHNCVKELLKIIKQERLIINQQEIEIKKFKSKIKFFEENFVLFFRNLLVLSNPLISDDDRKKIFGKIKETCNWYDLIYFQYDKELFDKKLEELAQICIAIKNNLDKNPGSASREFSGAGSTAKVELPPVALRGIFGSGNASRGISGSGNPFEQNPVTGSAPGRIFGAGSASGENPGTQIVARAGLPSVPPRGIFGSGNASRGIFDLQDPFGLYPGAASASGRIFGAENASVENPSTGSSFEQNPVAGSAPGRIFRR